MFGKIMFFFSNLRISVLNIVGNSHYLTHDNIAHHPGWAETTFFITDQALVADG